MSEEEMRLELLAFWKLLDSYPRISGLGTLKLIQKIDERHFLAGVDSFGARHLLIPIPKAIGDRNLWRSSAITLRKITLQSDNGLNLNWLDFHCRRIELESVFARVVVSVVMAALSRPMSQLEDSIVKSLEDWRGLLGSSVPRSESVVGLIAELLILEKLVSVDPSKAIQAWQGPKGGRHDFRRGAHAIEVKGTTRKVGHQIEIHGIEQLLPPNGGTLFLSHIRLEKVPSGSLSIASLTNRIIAAGVAREILFEIINESITLESAPNHELDSFECRDIQIYIVDDSFPRIVPQDLVRGELPQGVLRISYMIDIGHVVPIDDAISSNVFGALMK